MKILFIAGHGAGDPGACSSYGTESIETRQILKALKEKYKAWNWECDFYDENRNCYDDIGNGQLKVNFKNYDLVVEIHFNSFSSSSAKGCEIWIPSAEVNTSLEKIMLLNFESLGYVNRGVKVSDFRVIRNAKAKGAKALLLEVCFISNKEDMTKYRSKFNLLSEYILKAISTQYKISQIGNVPECNGNNNDNSIGNNILYRVRTTEGKQIGAFNILSNAKKMAESNNAVVYDSNNKVIVSYSKVIKVGSKVKITGEKYATGQTIPSWVKQNIYIIQQIEEDKVLVKEIISWVYKKDLTII